MTDDLFERDLRLMLAARDPGPASATLALRVRTRLETDGGPRRLMAASRWAGPAAVLAAIAAVLVVAVVVARPIPIGPGATPPVTPSAPYTIQPGDGVVVEDQVPVVHIIVGLLAFAALFVVVRIATDRRARLGAALSIALIGLVAAKIGTSDALAYGPIGEEVLDPGGHDPLGGARFFVDAVGDSPFGLVLTVTNTSRLPLEIQGIAEPPVLQPGTIPQLRFVGVGLIGDPNVYLGTAPRVAFSPVTLWPGERVDLALLGMAGQCAIAPATAAGGFSSIDDVEIVYEQLTLRHTATFVLPEPINVSEPDHCP